MHFRNTFKINRFIGLLFILFLFSGCFDNEDIDQRMIVSPLGIDAAPEGKMNVTLRFPIVTPGGTEHTDSNHKSFIVRFSTSNGILPAVIDAQNRDEHNVFLGQCRAVVFGETYAKRGLKPALDYLNRLPSIPPNAYIVVARPSAAEIMQLSWPEQELHDQNIRLFFSNRINDKYAIKLWSLFQKTYSALDDPLIPIVTPSDDNTTMKLVGMAVFQKDKMVGELNNEELMFIGLMKSPTQKNRIYLPAPGEISTGFEVITGKKRLKVTYHNNHPVFNYYFKYNAFLAELGGNNVPLNNRQIRQIENTSEQYLTKRFLAILRKLQSYQSDPLELGNSFRVQQSNHFLLKNWSKDYQQATFKVKVHMFIERLGVLK